MPHVVFDKKIDMELFSKEFQEIILKEPFLIKLLDVFLDRKKRVALIPTVVIDKLHQQFFIEISTRQDKTTIRLFPGTDPEKTDGVKMSLGLVAKIVQEINPNHRITRTNIREFLLADQKRLVIT
ncbi:hypothetical protein [Nitrosopumilus sp.]|uniref:hypothetical protein n=1 Tax=Nitrosopumilus sp. TaxID=2024843 RepID=UPI00292E5A1B|nr:hypothetical protein [Nitrosopumilus sp.]